ncbi:MAG: ammonia monooxygenase, partial [Nocardioidaceae bacterium]|nr:ammonia monooxygenase [Nocardioidaceae bacterium]
MRGSLAWLRLTALIAASIAILALIHAPSPTLFGGLVGSLIYALASRHELSLPPWAFIIGQAIVGISIGGMVDLPTLRGLGAHWVIVLAVTLGTLVLSVAAGQVLRLH